MNELNAITELLYGAGQPMVGSAMTDEQALAYAREHCWRTVRIPRHPATLSALIWPGIPRPSGHLFHGHPAGQSERSDAGVALLV